MRRLAIIALLVGNAFASSAQTPPRLLFDELRRHDLSMLWTGPLPLIDREDTTSLAWIERPDALGYIGDVFKRLRIRIRSIARSGADSLCYLLDGATRVGDNVCSFEGELHLDSLVRSPASDAPDEWGGIRSGWSLRGHYVLREHPDQPGAGIFEGIHTLDIATDAAGNIYYDTLMLVGDGYRNNQWQGTWRSYRGGGAKACCWGDFRIPLGEGLDIGTGEFSPADAYLDNGWRSYCDRYAADSLRRQRALAEEARRWWICF